MSNLKTILFIVVLIAAGVLVYRHLHRAPLSPEQFHSILTLTPQDLEARCGHPEQDTSGVVVQDDGIRDLRYHDAGGAEMVFRFISDDGKNWQSLGAWDQVNAPDDLGAPLPASETARRLPCAAKTEASTSSLNIPHGRRQRGGTEVYLAVILLGRPIQDIPIPEQKMPTPPTPTMPSIPTQTPTPIPMTTTGPIPYPGGPPPSEEPEPEPGPGPGPGPESPAVRTPMTLPCRSESGPCELLQYAQFVAEFNQAIRAERENDFVNAMNRLTQHGVMMVQLPALEVSRAQAVKAVVQLEVKAINLVEARLRDDVASLVPFSSEPSEVKAQKMAVVEQDDQQRRKMWKHAVESNLPAVSTSHSSSGNTMRFNSDAYQQLVQIHLTGNWP
jgi:hypothetical protein